MLAAGYLILSDRGLIPETSNEAELRAAVDGWGAWGPLLIVLLMATAIVISPLPSAPIAVAAGACFGSGLGTVYTVMGAELGAVAAFTIARLLGYETLRRWPAAGAVLERLGRKRSQNRLMAVVFASRLLPFLSFDLVSYAAGLTPLTFFRFALATLAGVIPISFALASLGDNMVAADAEQIRTYTVIGGCITLAPVALKLPLSVRSRQTWSASESCGYHVPGDRGNAERLVDRLDGVPAFSGRCRDLPEPLLFGTADARRGCTAATAAVALLGQALGRPRSTG